MSPDGDPETLRLRVPTALQVVMALDIAVAVLFLSMAVFAGLHAAGQDWLLDAGGLLLILVGYAGCGIWISVSLGRASQIARVGQAVWSSLWIVCFLGPWDGAGLDGSWGVLSVLPIFLLVAPIVSLGLLFAPSVRAFFATVRAHR